MGWTGHVTRMGERRGVQKFLVWNAEGNRTLGRLRCRREDIYKRKEGGRGLVQAEAIFKTEKINISKYLNTKYKEDQLVNIFKHDDSTQPNMNSKLKLATWI
jgi:hypothetical protein